MKFRQALLFFQGEWTIRHAFGHRIGNSVVESEQVCDEFRISVFQPGGLWARCPLYFGSGFAGLGFINDTGAVVVSRLNGTLTVYRKIRERLRQLRNCGIAGSIKILANCLHSLWRRHGGFIAENLFDDSPP